MTAKITDYLLNPAHPDNGGKFNFFAQLGFSRDAWQLMATALKRLAESNDVAAATKSPHGHNYVIVGRLESPKGKSPLVRTIWMWTKGSISVGW